MGAHWPLLPTKAIPPVFDKLYQNMQSWRGLVLNVE